MISNLPPGTILQLMYLRSRLRNLNRGSFLEIGPCAGEITALLLNEGWKGIVCDLDSTTIGKIEDRFQNEINSERLETICGDFLGADYKERFDVVISSMVLEHLPDNSDQL